MLNIFAVTTIFLSLNNYALRQTVSNTLEKSTKHAKIVLFSL